MTDPKAAASPEPVAWIAYGGIGEVFTSEYEAGLNSTPSMQPVPLYRHPPVDRIALLESLLREISGWDMMDVAADGKYWRERIRKALGEGI